MIIINTRELFNLNGKVAIVTGSTKGLGKGIAETLAEYGAKVVITSRHQDDCNKIANEINKKYGVSTLPVSTDVTELSEVKSLVNKTLDEFNEIDILINNAGTAITKKAENITEKEWDYILEVNLKGYFLMAREVGKHMIEKEQGKIINVSSIFGGVGEKMILPYLASKGGVNQLTRGLALEWAEYNVQVNALAPAYIVTPMNKDEISQEPIKSHIINKTPAKQFGKIDDIKGAIILLASDAGNYITGEILEVDGGWTAH